MRALEAVKRKISTGRRGAFPAKHKRNRTRVARKEVKKHSTKEKTARPYTQHTTHSKQDKLTQLQPGGHIQSTALNRRRWDGGRKARAQWGRTRSGAAMGCGRCYRAPAWWDGVRAPLQAVWLSTTTQLTQQSASKAEARREPNKGEPNMRRRRRRVWKGWSQAGKNGKPGSDTRTWVNEDGARATRWISLVGGAVYWLWLDC